MRGHVERGPLGFPVVDIAVTLTDGQFHTVDSSEMAFRKAAATGDARGDAGRGPVLLEPIYRVAMHAPAQFTGSLGPIISSMPARCSASTDADAKGWEIFRAIVPGGALAAIANDIRATTQGVGWFEASFDHYDELHGKAADRVVQERAREPA